MDKPRGSLLVQLVNIFNLFFLLIVYPLVAILLITRSLETIDPTHLTISARGLLMALEVAGLVVYVAGFLLMAWALVSLGRNYQLGGSTPRVDDHMVMVGPYRLIRHPMYTSALCISLGLACLAQSGTFLAVFCIYLALVLPLIPMEETGLEKAYGEQYVDYQRTTKKIFPFLY